MIERHDGSAIEAVRTSTAVIDLPEPLVLGAMTIARREYSAVQVTAQDGLVGKAYCLTREAPMAEIVDRLITPHMLGSDSDDPTAAWDRALRGSAIVGRVGLVRRAIGIVDIAIWDIAAQRAGVPVWQLAGVSGDDRPAMLVAAYPMPTRSVDAIVDEVVSQAREGWPLVKIARSPDRVVMRQILARLADELPARTGLVVDVGFGWRDSDEALAEIETWGDLRLAWLEDPLLPEDAAGCARIRHESGLRIGVGDEVTDPRVLRDLIEIGDVDVLRVDVVALGGITPALEVIHMADSAGVEVSGHVYPEVSVHLGIGVETFNRSLLGNRYDPSPLLVVGGPEFVSGYARPPHAPGLGFALSTEAFDF